MAAINEINVDATKRLKRSGRGQERRSDEEKKKERIIGGREEETLRREGKLEKRDFGEETKEEE